LGNRSMAPLTSGRHARAADTRVTRTRSKQRLGDPRPRHLPFGPVASTRDNLPQQAPRRLDFLSFESIAQLSMARQMLPSNASR
jgi:hypothetical protein